MTPATVTPRYTIRHARTADIPAIRLMQQRSMWVLGSDFYSDDEIADFLTRYGTMDDVIVEEGRFFVAENQAGNILGSGGWTCRRPGYESGLGDRHDTEASPTVRSVFVDPAAERRGIASSIMARVERDALEQDVRELALTATLPGIPLYTRLGYLGTERTQVALGNGLSLACMKMAKQFPDPRELAA